MLRRYGVVLTDAWRTETSTSYYRQLLARRMTRRGAEKTLTRLARHFGQPKAGSDGPPAHGWLYQPGYDVLDLRSLAEQEWLDINRP
jgi:hypothetical protein